jgi:flagellar basal body-associated protein FliL
MADKDKEDKGAKEVKEAKTADDKDGSSKPAEVKVKTGIFTWVIMITVIVVLSSSGFVLGRLLARSSSSDTAKAPQENISKESASKKEAPKKEAPKKEASKESASKTSESTPANGTWYYNDLESVVVNPNEPGATRFIRVGLILEMSEELSQEKTKELIQAKKPLLINWLNLYFKGLALNEMENEKDLNRILAQARDAFNEILFPEAKPQIKKILIREFNIQ